MTLHASYDPQIRKGLRRRSCAVLPVGSIEQHGAHLPVTTDTDIVTAISKKLADNIGAILLPTVSYGVSIEHAPLFQLSVKESTLYGQVTQICSSLEQNKIRDIFVINGHHGNQKALDRIKCPRVRVFSYWHFMERKFDHAGFVETSLMLAITDTVRMSLAKKGLDEESLSPVQLARARKTAAKSFPKATGNGIWGDPRGASKKDGAKILAEVIRNLTSKCRDCI